MALAGEQGVTLALYSLAGFIGAGIGPLTVGALLDLGGGFGSARAWFLGLAGMGIGSALAALAITFVANSRSKEEHEAGTQREQ